MNPEIAQIFADGDARGSFRFIPRVAGVETDFALSKLICANLRNLRIPSSFLSC
jgi:hypothetical protein